MFSTQNAVTAYYFRLYEDTIECAWQLVRVGP